MQPWWPTYSRTILIAHGSERGTCPVDAGGAVVVSRVQQPRAKCTAPPAFPLTSGPVLDEASVHPQQPRPRPQLDPPPAHLQPDFPHPSPSDRVRVSLPLGPPEDLLRLRSPSCRPHALRSRLLCHRLAPAIAMRPTTSAWPAFLRRSIFPLYAWHVRARVTLRHVRVAGASRGRTRTLCSAQMLRAGPHSGASVRSVP